MREDCAAAVGVGTADEDAEVLTEPDALLTAGVVALDTGEEIMELDNPALAVDEAELEIGADGADPELESTEDDDELEVALVLTLLAVELTVLASAGMYKI